ncbi:MAG: Holliday junction resolvase RuvX [Pseudomonadota bacterium]
MPAGEVLLGFDYGTRRIGVAVGDSITRRARPLTTVKAAEGKPDWRAIQALLDEWRPDALVVGLPYNMDDSESEIAPLARRFARQLEGRFGLPVHLVDERLTTHEAEAHLGAEASRRRELDPLAAALILETWFGG